MTSTATWPPGPGLILIVRAWPAAAAPAACPSVSPAGGRADSHRKGAVDNGDKRHAESCHHDDVKEPDQLGE
jgi:hypothetical protein